MVCLFHHVLSSCTMHSLKLLRTKCSHARFIDVYEIIYWIWLWSCDYLSQLQLSIRFTYNMYTSQVVHNPFKHCLCRVLHWWLHTIVFLDTIQLPSLTAAAASGVILGDWSYQRWVKRYRSGSVPWLGGGGVGWGIGGAGLTQRIDVSWCVFVYETEQNER